MWQYRTGGNLTTFNKDYGTAEEGRLRRFLQLSIRLRYNYYVHVQSPTESHWSIWRIRDQATTIQYFDRFLPLLLPPYTPTMAHQKKTNRQEHPPEVISVIWALYYMGYSALKIQLENGLPKLTIISIIRRVRKHPSNPFCKALRTGRPPKLNARAKRRLVRFIANNPFKIITSLLSPLKSGYRMHINTTRRYLAKNHYYSQKPL